MKNFLAPIIAIFLFQTLGVSQSYSVLKIDEEVLESADLIVRNSSQIHDITNPNLIKSTYNHVYTIVNSKAKHIGDINIYFQEDISKIKDVKITIYDALGREIKKVKKKEIKEIKAYSSTEMADDLRLLSFKSNYKKYPYTIEYSYSKESKYAVTIPTYSPYPYLDYLDTYVEKSTYEIIGDPNDFKSKAKNIELFKESINLSNYPSKIKVEDLPVFEIDKYSPPAIDIYPHVDFARIQGKFNKTEVEFEDWNSYGEWMYNAYLKDKYTLTEEAKSKVKELTENASSEFDKAKRIYEYVVNNTRYVSIQLGEGGLEPFYAKDVHEKKYGDCKALSMYSLALMKEADINAFYVVIEAGTESQVDFDTDFASIQQGNHAIIGVEIGLDTIYADCTTSNSPFGTISSFTDGRLAVGIDENGGKLIKTKKYKDKENVCKINTNMTINPSTRELSIDYKSESSGCDISSKINYYKFSETEIKSKVLPYFYPQFSKENFFDVDLKYEDNQYKESFKIETKKFITTAGNYLILPLQIHALDLEKVNESKRNTPFYFKNGYTIEYTTIIEIPEGYEWAGGIETQEIKSSFGNFNVKKIEVQNNALHIHMKMETNSGNFSENMLEEFNNWVPAVKKLETEKIIFRPLK